MRADVPAWVACTGFGVLAVLVVAVAGQPLITDDAWLHLALGRAYAQAGPWLDADPLLANASAAPTPTSWLFDLGAHGVLSGAGFAGLRIAHVALVVAILWRVFAEMKRASGSAIGASLGSGLFVVLAAYRLVQLRPHLFTMLAVLVVYRLALARDVTPSRGRVVAVVALSAVWANVHAAFLLGPMLLGAGLVAAVAALPLTAAERRPALRARAIFIALCGGLGALATLANPAGLTPHLSWFVAGSDTPTLDRVADEWMPVDPFSLPLPGLPPSPLAWLIAWAVALGVIAIVLFAVRAGFRRDAPARGDDDLARGIADPVLIALAIVGIALPLVAVRFLWLGFFPLLLLADRARGVLAAQGPRARAIAWGSAAICLTLAPAFVRFGDWPMVASALPTSWSAYRVPYQAGKYHADLIWILQDARLQGTAFADYHLAGFAGFELAPDVRMLINGTLNVPPDVISANRPLRARSGERDGETYTELLDRHGIDLFVGIRLPRTPVSARPWFYTTGHLERTEGWIPIFRNLTGAVYLRRNARNEENLARIAAFYAEQGLPFDPAVGFDPERIIRVDRVWATRHGVVPLGFDQISQAAFGPDRAQRDGARDALASIYLALGLYERAIDLDSARLDADPAAVGARRRLVWSLLRLRRIDEALVAAEGLAARPPGDRISHRIADGARAVARLDDEEAVARAIAQLPVFSGAEANALTRAVVRPGPRVEAD